ncbi:hypothetical protein ACFL27_01610 [candidate division CSSED10-310 bacterium]|uniref:Uncharacterized protein n=1 Tax=candidate division CSSED10-310 bacterium TaxID=2855610 RepID=A0ABV6YRR5_UNCC1
MNQKKLVVCEFADEIESYLEYAQKTSRHSSDYVVVSLQPEVKAFCKTGAIPCFDTLPYFTGQAQERALIKSDEITRLISGHLDFGIREPVCNIFGNVFLYHARFYINTILWILEVLRGIHQEFPDGEFQVIRRTYGQTGWPLEPYLVKRDRFMPLILQKYCAENGLQFQEITIPTPAGAEYKKPSPASRMMKAVTRVVVRKKLRKLSESKVVLLTANSYNLDRVCRELGTKFPEIMCTTINQRELSPTNHLKIWWQELARSFQEEKDPGSLVPIPLDVFKREKPTTALSHSLEERYDEFTARFGVHFSYHHVSFLSELTQKIKTDLLPFLVNLYNTAQAQQQVLQALEPKLLLSPLSINTHQSWAELCQRQGIPALVIPQKGLVAPKNKCAKIEQYYIGKGQISDDFSHAAAQTPLVAQYLDWTDYKGHIIETGNLIFSKIDDLKRKQKRQELFEQSGGSKKIIVYAPSMKSRKSRRFYVLESLDELLSSLGDIFEVIATMENVHFIFRIHPGEPISSVQIRKLLRVPQNVSISDRGTYEDVLALADLVISYSSTAIQEALINRIPVVLYDKWNRYNHLDAPPVTAEVPLKTAAAYYIDHKTKLEPALGWILDEHEKKPLSADLFTPYMFPESRTANFFRFVEQCLARNRAPKHKESESNFS